MAVDKDYISALSPGFSTIDDTRLAALLSIASSIVKPAVWGDQYDYAVALYVLHLFTLGKMNGRGSVTQETIGDITRQYASPGANAKDAGGLALTSWGQQYRALGMGRVKGPLVTGGR